MLPTMLKHRLMFGTLMVAGGLGLLAVDDRLDRVRLHGWASSLFLGREYLPAGLLMLVLILAIIVLASRELCRIFHAEGIDASPIMIAVSGFLGALLIYLIPDATPSQLTIAIYASFMVMIFIGSLVRYSWRGVTQGAVSVAAVTMFAVIYLGTMPGFYLAIRRYHSVWVVVAIIAVTKACDIGAYFTGRAFGKHKLIPWLSPGKTWEGLAGGVVLSAILATMLAAVSNHLGWSGRYAPGNADASGPLPVAMHYPLWYAAIAGLIIGFVGQVGDLTASLFKRDAGIKDSGSAIPGFGGFLDVVDSPILVAPLAYWLLYLARLVE